MIFRSVLILYYSLMISILFLTPANSSAQQAPSHLSMDEALELFARNNPELQAARAAARQQAAETKIQSLWPNPSAELEQERMDQNAQQFIILEQPIRNPVEYRLRRRSTKLQRTAVYANYREVAGSLTFGLRQAYIEAAAAQRRVQIQIRITGVVRRVYRIAQERTEAGDLGNFELHRLSTAVATYEDELAQSQTEQKIALRELLTLTNSGMDAILPDTTHLSLIKLDSLVYSPSEINSRQLLARGNSRRGLLQLARANGRADSVNYQAEQWTRVPEISVRGGVTGEPSLQESPSPYLGVGLSFPFWNWHGPQIRAARFAMRGSQARLNQAGRTVALDINSAIDRIESLSRRIEKISQGILKDSDSLLSNAVYLFSEGNLSLVELLDTADAAQQAQMLKTQLLREYYISRFDLDRAVGTLPEQIMLSETD